MLLAAGSGFIVFGGTYAMVAVEPYVPPPPPPPPLARETTFKHSHTEGFYKALLVADAKYHGVSGFNPDSIRQANRFQPEFRGRYKLRRGSAGLETEHLIIKSSIEKDWVQERDNRYRTDHLHLLIENKTHVHLAYLVDTGLTEEWSCASKGNIGHNALTIRPRETIERTECLYSPVNDLWVERVDVMEISALGYYYVARLTPAVPGVDARIATAHRIPGRAKACRHIPQDQVKAAGTPEARWQRIVDFYSRHNCDEYWFFSGYKVVEQALVKLVPARPAE